MIPILYDTSINDTKKEVNRIMRIFAYCRVSTTEQTTENQIIAIRQKGYKVMDSRIVSETVSGSVEAIKREKFKMLINHKMEKGDMLVVLKLDRLGVSDQYRPL